MQQIDSTTFEAEVIQASVPVVVDFFTDHCHPCRMLAPVLAELETERAGSLKVIKIDAASEAEFAASFRVMSVPTLLLFNRGQLVAQTTGLKSKRDLQKWIDEGVQRSN